MAGIGYKRGATKYTEGINTMHKDITKGVAWEVNYLLEESDSNVGYRQGCVTVSRFILYVVGILMSLTFIPQ
jgi:hypothetical protein